MMQRSALSERVYFVFNTVMILLYLSGGIFLYFWNDLQLPSSNRKMLSVVLIFYAAYRVFHLVRRKKMSPFEK